jgi:exopolyphosphatase/guanosine-5'-triphosphate,3'-diphosphate pyrophosphatase
MVEGRQDVIVGGALILRQVMERLGMAECLVSESDILDGLVMSLQGDR